jgi:hypothetical protein
MIKPYTILAAVLVVVLQACSSETAKRTAFETLQNLHEQQCAQDLYRNCPPRERYDDYQDKRKEAQSFQ